MTPDNNMEEAVEDETACDEYLAFELACLDAMVTESTSQGIDEAFHLQQH